MIFDFIVRRLRWLARLPLAPQFFDALLLAWTGLSDPGKLAAMEALEARAIELSGVRPRCHRFGGAGFARDGREFAHLHGNGLLDVRLTRESAAAIVAAGRALPHHLFGPSPWVSFRVRSAADVPEAVRLLTLGANLGRGGTTNHR